MRYGLHVFVLRADLRLRIGPGAMSDFDSKLHLLAGLFHVVERHSHGVPAGTVHDRRYRLVRLVFEVEYQREQVKYKDLIKSRNANGYAQGL